MTADQITEATAFIIHPALRACAAARLASGDAFICHGCNQIADTLNGCYPCDDARFEAQAAEYDAAMTNAEAAAGCDPYAGY